MKKLLVLLIVTVVSTGCGISTSETKVQTDENTQMIEEVQTKEEVLRSENTIRTLNCGELDKKIKDLVDENSYCSENSDCIVIGLVHCTPLGSYGLINKNANTSEAKRYINEYTAKCPKEICKPILSPNPEEIQCKNNKCVDTRF